MSGAVSDNMKASNSPIGCLHIKAQIETEQENVLSRLIIEELKIRTKSRYTPGAVRAKLSEGVMAPALAILVTGKGGIVFPEMKLEWMRDCIEEIEADMELVASNGGREVKEEMMKEDHLGP